MHLHDLDVSYEVNIDGLRLKTNRMDASQAATLPSKSKVLN